jgi:hypothetical protein
MFALVFSMAWISEVLVDVLPGFDKAQHHGVLNGTMHGYSCANVQ